MVPRRSVYKSSQKEHFQAGLAIQFNAIHFYLSPGGHFFLNVQFPPHAFISVPFLSTRRDEHFGVPHREIPEHKIYFAKTNFLCPLNFFFLTYAKKS